MMEDTTRQTTVVHDVSANGTEPEQFSRIDPMNNNTTSATKTTTTTTTRTRTTAALDGSKDAEQQEQQQPHQHHCSVTPHRMHMNEENLPFGNICDDIAIDNDTPYVRLYCQNVNGIFDRDGIGLDLAFREIKQAGADIFTFNETHGDDSNAVARRALRLSKQRKHIKDSLIYIYYKLVNTVK